MSGLTSLGIVHTAISVLAVAAGIAALVRHRAIDTRSRSGRAYVVLTVLTCVTGFGIFQHGGFGKPHMLGIITLVVLALAWIAGTGRVFGRASRYIEIVGYSATLFFHAIPAITEGMTRLPAAMPLADGPEAPVIHASVAVCFVVFLIGAALQIVGVHRARTRAGAIGALPTSR